MEVKNYYKTIKTLPFIKNNKKKKRFTCYSIKILIMKISNENINYQKYYFWYTRDYNFVLKLSKVSNLMKKKL